MGNPSPLVSVLLPYRNCESTIASAIQSVLAERGVPLQLVAVDDGSTDSGPAIVSQIAAHDERVLHVHTGGVGIAKALAHGVSLTEAPFIGRMDGDDISLTGRLSAQLEMLSRDVTLGAVATQVEGFPSSAVGEGLARYIDWQNGLVSVSDHRRELFVESPICHPSVVLRRSALEAAGGFVDVHWAEDYDLWLRLDSKGFGIAKVARILFQWRHREGRLTFADKRYALSLFDEAKAHYLAPKLRADGRPFTLWGAGKTGRRIARALEQHGLRPIRFVDIDPKKIGRVARAAPIVGPEQLRLGESIVVCAVGARGARALIREHLVERGFSEGADFLFVS